MSIKAVLDKYEETNAKGTIIVGDYNDGERDYVYIEGPAEGLRSIAELLLAHADDTETICDWSISPEGAGFVWFDERSPKGLFIHRVPCEYGRLEEERALREASEPGQSSST